MICIDVLYLAVTVYNFSILNNTNGEAITPVM